MKHVATGKLLGGEVFHLHNFVVSTERNSTMHLVLNHGSLFVSFFQYFYNFIRMAHENEMLSRELKVFVCGPNHQRRLYLASIYTG